MMGGMRPTVMRARVLGLCMALAVGLIGTAHADVLKVGDRLAELDVAVDAGGKPFKLKALRGKWVVLAWFPKAFTSG